MGIFNALTYNEFFDICIQFDKVVESFLQHQSLFTAIFCIDGD